MDAQHEQAKDLGSEILAAFRDLTHLSHHGTWNNADEFALMMSALLERLRQLCQAACGAIVLTARPANEQRKMVVSFAMNSKEYRPLAVNGIKEEEVEVLLTSMVVGVPWASLEGSEASWQAWRLPLILSFSTLQSQEIEWREAEQAGDALAAPHALLLFGWEQCEGEQRAQLMERSRHLLSPLADAIGAILVQALTSEYIQELETHTDHRALREMELLKAEMLASVSHELRSPLTSIKGYAATLLRHEKRISREERHEFLLAINDASDRLAGVIDSLLEMSELETGRIEVKRAPVDLTYLVQEVLTAAEQKLGVTAQGASPFVIAPAVQNRAFLEVLLKTSHDVATDQDQQLIIQADRNRLREVLDHLLDNAIKHTPMGGTVRLLLALVNSAEDLKEPAVLAHDGSVRLAQAQQRYQHMVVIGVQDSGRGIPQGALERIFDPFYRVDTRLTREVNGLGLGLAICRRIIELHHGSIWAESREGGGSTLFVCLPIDKKDREQAESELFG